jgi:hypothetical protein
MENKGLITRDKLDPSLKLMPFKDTAEHKESLFSYYYACAKSTTWSATRGWPRCSRASPSRS